MRTPAAAFWYFLEPDRLVAYEFDDGAQVLREAQPISRRYTSRDLRGRLDVADALHVQGIRRRSSLRRRVESQLFRGMPRKCRPAMADGDGHLDLQSVAQFFLRQHHFLEQPPGEISRFLFLRFSFAGDDRTKFFPARRRGSRRAGAAFRRLRLSQPRVSTDGEATLYRSPVDAVQRGRCWPPVRAIGPKRTRFSFTRSGTAKRSPSASRWNFRGRFSRCGPWVTANQCA